MWFYFDTPGIIPSSASWRLRIDTYSLCKIAPMGCPYEMLVFSALLRACISLLSGRKECCVSSKIFTWWDSLRGVPTESQCTWEQPRVPWVSLCVVTHLALLRRKCKSTAQIDLEWRVLIKITITKNWTWSKVTITWSCCWGLLWFGIAFQLEDDWNR